MISTTTPSLTLALALAFIGIIPPPSVNAQSSSTSPPNTLLAYPILYSHLSPLCRYSPPSSWTINQTSAYATEKGANFSIVAHGGLLIINGDQSGDAHLYSDPEIPKEGYPNRFVINRFNRSDQAGFRGELLYVDDLANRRHEVSIGLPEEEQGQFLNVTRVQRFTQLPAPGRPGSVPSPTGQPTVLGNSTISPFYTDVTSNAWSIRNLSTEETACSPETLPSVWFRDEFDPPFPTNSVISTNTTSAPIRVTVPPLTQIVQWYGGVGPNHGEFEIKLMNESAIAEELLEIHPLTVRLDAGRPVEMSKTLLMIAYLDPRVKYEIEFSLVEEGKVLDLNGMFFYSVLESEEQAGNLVEPWYRLYDEAVLGIGRKGGLSGGQIAGIVVGSVAGATILAGIAFWLWRRNKRSKNGAGAHGAAARSKSANEISMDTLQTLPK